MVIRNAVSNDAKYLSSLAVRSKAHWGYSAEFMEACVEELSVSRATIENSDFHYVVAVFNEGIIGFYSLEGLYGAALAFRALFVAPCHIGTGGGKFLIESAKSHAANLGACKLNVHGDPNAEKFYRAAGGVPTGS